MTSFFKFLETLLKYIDNYIVAGTCWLLFLGWLYGIVVAKGFLMTAAAVFLIIPAWVLAAERLIVYFHLPL